MVSRRSCRCCLGRVRHHLPTFAQVDLSELDLKDPIGILGQNSKKGFYKVIQWQRGGRS